MKPSIYAKARELIYLSGVNAAVGTREFFHFFTIASRYYSNLTFFKVDMAMKARYFFDNPFAISKRYMQSRGAENLYVYGETPLTTWEKIASVAQISSQDTLFELGAGRGRLCFWSRLFLKCSVVGVEQIPKFVGIANELTARFHLDKLTFIQDDFLKVDLSDATVIYLYGTCLDDNQIIQLAKKLAQLKNGTKIITVSYPLTDYHKGSFEVMHRFPAKFTWGEGDVYVQVVSKNNG